MAIQVIGAGISKTGTISMKKALEILGFGKCYHMYEAIQNPPHIRFWHQKLKENLPGFDNVFQGYQSIVDLPGCMYYRELMEYYPQAKVILSLRDPDQWYQSASETILRKFPRWFITSLGMIRFASTRISDFLEFWDYLKDMMHREFFQGKMDDPEAMKEFFMQWNQQVMDTVPPEKLLVYKVSEGWEPLCKFLKVPVPDVPFPLANTRGEFNSQVKKFHPMVFNPGKLLRKKKPEILHSTSKLNLKI